MTISHAATTKKTWAVRTGIAGIAAATLAVSGIAIAANAAGPSFAPYDEGDSPNPYNVTEGLVFYRGADMGWVVNAPIADVESLAYTVADGTSYAPSFQLVARADRDGFTNKYTRLVWEPYMHNPKLPHRLQRLNMPTLFIRGASDGLVRADYITRYAALVKGARVVTIAEAGHAPQAEAPQALAAAVLDFLAA